jgi:hypothetical protein
MKNDENIVNNDNKIVETLTKELEGLNDEELHEFFMFFYKLNHQQYNMIVPDAFEKFLSSFDSNPFKINNDKTFKKELIENIIEYAYDHLSLITAAVLIKKKFTIDEVAQNYYSNVNLFEHNWF